MQHRGNDERYVLTLGEAERLGMEVMWADPSDLIGYETISGGRLSSSRDRYYGKTRPIAVVPYTSWGDYCGGICERANYGYFLGDPELTVNERQTDEDCIAFIGISYMFHGYAVGVVIGREIPSDLVELIEGLHHYPIIDDETWELEMAIHDEDYSSWIAHDVQRSIRERFGDEEGFGLAVDEATEEEFRTLYEMANAENDGNPWWEVETATNGYLTDETALIDKMHEIWERNQ